MKFFVYIGGSRNFTCFHSGFSEEDLISTGITFTRPDAYNVVAQKGNPLLLNCSVGSNGTARFSWYKDGEPLDLSNQRRVQVVNGSLSFKRVLFRRKKNVTDEGVYECHVRNQIGSIIAKRVKVVIAGEKSHGCGKGHECSKGHGCGICFVNLS